MNALAGVALAFALSGSIGLAVAFEPLARFVVRAHRSLD